LALSLATAGAVSTSACQTPQPPYYYGGLALPPYYAGPPPPAYFGLPPGPPPGPSHCAQWVFDYAGDRVCTAYD
jgi:hypothetical protein